ncbi:LysR family transcriptional regulator [Ramlibacter sp.]|uniref:LysR family transcriptional regulator n=1 Tax=Ramlibacter sp. TaxID=1917967 RepID=UPI002FC699B7|nr:LysR family transcriptional regulator [Ramlibacter sp.]MCE3271805.1 LysR family transcriptional regulator [Ramlibacter sp.]
MAMNIKYRPVKAFLLAVQTGSFTLAADRLGVTQPSFTALIRDLEDILGVRLFDRNTRGIALTAAGKDFLARTERPMTDLEEAYRSMLDLAAVRRGSVVVGSLPSTSLTLVPPALRLLRAAHPTLRVRVVEAHNDDLVAMVRTNQIEFAIAAQLGPAADLAFETLLEDTFTVVFPAGHEVAAHPRLYWRDIVRHDLILLSRGSSVRELYDEATQEGTEASAAASRYDVTHMTTAIRLVRQGLGITVLPALALPELDLHGLMSCGLHDASARRTIGVLHRRDRSLSTAAAAFASKLAGVAREVAGPVNMASP